MGHFLFHAKVQACPSLLVDWELWLDGDCTICWLIFFMYDAVSCSMNVLVVLLTEGKGMQKPQIWTLQSPRCSEMGQTHFDFSVPVAGELSCVDVFREFSLLASFQPEKLRRRSIEFSQCRTPQ